jgi:MinD superfamily P-loop ATPase
MKQLVILSGKGGTGKTSVAAAFAHLAFETLGPRFTVLADADVDAANLELVLAPQVLEKNEFRGGQVAVIDHDICTMCGRCEEVCRFDAISMVGDRTLVDDVACDGCAACVFECPVEAIVMQDQVVGHWFRSDCRYGPLYHAALYPGQENSGKLVTMVKQFARLLAMDEDRELVLVDGPPGIGCPVISATSGADMVLLAAEPTVSGVHDMQRALQTAQHFGVPAVVCINKADVYPKGADEIESFCLAEGIEMVGRIPFDLTVTKAMVNGEAVTAFAPEAPSSQALRSVWERTAAALGVMKV